MDDIIYCCKITDMSENSDILPEFLNAFELEFSTWNNAGEKIAWHTVYSKNSESACEAEKMIIDHLAEWKEYGINIAETQLLQLKKEDWSEVWKKYFNIQHISERLVIKPSWLDFTPSEKQTVVEIDPGMSFGTGQHPTTVFCLRMIDRLSANASPKSFLDAGCGSGILSIAAFKLGFSGISAFDIDPDAVKIAKENFDKNNISETDIMIKTSGIEEFASVNSQYDVITANILAPVLMENKNILLSMLKTNGFLILAGILSTEYGKVRELFLNSGCTEEYVQSEKEWTGGLFRKRSIYKVNAHLQD